MTTYRLQIEPTKKHKGRSFEAHLLNLTTCNAAWDSGASDHHRPIFVAYATTEQESNAFTANLRTGRLCTVYSPYNAKEGRIQLLPSAGYQWHQQRVTEGAVVTTAYLPQLFALEREFLDPDRLCFAFAPPTWWIDQHVSTNGDRELICASYLAAYLDRRTALPIIHDERFHLRLYRAIQEQHWWDQPEPTSSLRGTRNRTTTVYPGRLLGLDTFAVVNVNAQTFSEFLRHQTSSYFEEERPDHGTHRVPSTCRLLPLPVEPGQQLGLFPDMA